MKPDTSIDPRILKSAKEEFLIHGYKNSSLKTICAKAQVTTGALYKRYSGKEALFKAVVEPTINDLLSIAEMKKVKNPKDVTDKELIEAWDMSEDYMLWWFEFLYQRYDGFVLLLCSSEGSSYSSFSQDWVAIMTKYSYNYYQEAYQRGLSSIKIDDTEMQILLSAFWTIVYQPFIHSYTWEQIVEHCHIVCRLFDWYKVLGFEIT